MSQSVTCSGLSSHPHPNVCSLLLLAASVNLQGRVHTCPYGAADSLTCGLSRLKSHSVHSQSPMRPLQCRAYIGTWQGEASCSGMLPLVPCLFHANPGVRKSLPHVYLECCLLQWAASPLKFRDPQATMMCTMDRFPPTGSPRVRAQTLTPVAQQEACSVAPGERGS